MVMLKSLGALAIICVIVSGNDPTKDCLTTGCLNGVCVPGNGAVGNGFQGNSFQGSGVQGNGFQGNGFQGSGVQGSGFPGSNTQGATTSSKCICNPGFIKNPLDENVCSDIDECKLANGRICGAGKCINSPPGSYRCQCHPTMSIPLGSQYCLYRPQNNGVNMPNIIYWRMMDEMFF